MVISLKTYRQLGLAIHASLSTYLILIALLFGCSSCGIVGREARSIRNDPSNEAIIATILREIEECPSWLWTVGDKALSRQDVIARLKRISQYEPRQVRAALIRYIKSRKAINSYWVQECSKIYVLNRFYCKVPEWGDLEDPHSFGGWSGIPMKERKIALLWPLKVTSSGGLELLDVSTGFYGDEYLGLEEFDQFLKKYGVRPPIKAR